MQIKTLFVSLLVLALALSSSLAMDRYKYTEIWQQPYDRMNDEVSPEQASDQLNEESSPERRPSAVDDQSAPVPTGVKKLHRGTEDWKVYHEFHR